MAPEKRYILTRDDEGVYEGFFDTNEEALAWALETLGDNGAGALYVVGLNAWFVCGLEPLYNIMEYDNASPFKP